MLPYIGKDALDAICRRVEIEQGRVLGLAPGAAAFHHQPARHGLGQLPAVIALDHANGEIDAADMPAEVQRLPSAT